MIRIPIELLSTVDLFGFYVPPLFFWLAVAAVPFLLLRWLLARLRLYRLVWHRALFDLSLYVIVLGGMVMAGGSPWL